MPRTARARHIEADRVDQAAADEEQAIAGHVAGEPGSGEHQTPLARFERDGFDAAFIEGRVLEADREEDPGRARQRIGPAMRVLVARLVERRERDGRRRRDPGRAAARRSGSRATTIVPSGAHVAPRGLPPTSATSSTGPPPTATLASLRSVKNATHRPSGEKNGCQAPSVPGRRRSAGSRSSRR